MAWLDILVEVFTWSGFGGAALCGFLAVVLWAADGSWLPAEGVVEESADGPVARWFDDAGDVNEATLTDAEAREVAGAGDSAVIHLWYRHGWRGRMRLRRTNPAVAAVLRLAAGFAALGFAALVTGWVLLFARG